MVRCSAVLAVACQCTSLGAQSYPVKPIQLFVAFAPGGAGDIVARIVAKKMGENMGKPVVVENRPSPVVAVAAVARARPDGYTLLMAGSGTALTSALFKALPYDLIGDFRHVSALASFDLAMIVSGEADFESLAQVLAYAKANPGKLNIATSRIGSTQHLTAEMFKSMAGIDAVIVPYRTTADIIVALRSNDVQMAVEILPPVLEQITGKSVKALAVTSSIRFPGLSKVPTVSESAIPGFEASSWNGISVPANTPDQIVDRLSREIEAAIASPEVQMKLRALGMVARSGSSEQMTQRLKNDITKWKAVIDKAGIPRL